MCYKTCFYHLLHLLHAIHPLHYKSSLKWNEHKSTDSCDLMQTIKASRKRNGFEWVFLRSCSFCLLSRFLSFYPITEEINKGWVAQWPSLKSNWAKCCFLTVRSGPWCHGLSEREERERFRKQERYTDWYKWLNETFTGVEVSWDWTSINRWYHNEHDRSMTYLQRT